MPEKSPRRPLAVLVVAVLLSTVAPGTVAASPPSTGTVLTRPAPSPVSLELRRGVAHRTVRPVSDDGVAVGGPQGSERELGATNVQPPSPRRAQASGDGAASLAPAGSRLGRLASAATPTAPGIEAAPSFPLVDLATQIADHGSKQFRTPPDAFIAVGPQVVVEMVNSTMSVWRKVDGALLTDPVIDLDEIFAIPAGWSYGDPRVSYDAAEDRWYASIHAVSLSAGRSEVQLAVSDTGDPVGAWTAYVVAAQQDDLLYDQPRLGFTGDKILLGWDNFLFSGGFVGAQFAVVEKAQVLALAPVVDTAMSTADDTAFAIVPAVNRSAGDEGFLVWNDGNPAFLPPGTFPRLVVLRATGTPATGGVSVTERHVPMRASVPPPQADDATTDPPGGPSNEDKIDGGDDRLLQAEWQDGWLWTAASNGCVPPGDARLRVCSRLLQIDTNAETMRQDFDVSQAGGDVFFPSVAFNGFGDAVFGFSAVTPSTFIAAVGATQLSSDRNLVRGLTLIQEGEVPYAAHACFVMPPFGHRWGDYSGAAPDPSSPLHGWVAGEYAKQAPPGTPTSTADGDCNWGTAAARLTFPAPAISHIPTMRGGQIVTIAGSDFTVDTTVRIDGDPVDGVSVIDSTTLRFPAPAHAPGIATVSVATPYGTSAPFTARYPDGYWLTASDGGIFAFGDAAFFGSTGDIALNKPVVAIAATSTGDGYWLTASDGGIFAFGDAAFFGSTGGLRLNSPVVAMARTPSGEGYWLTASDGGIFAFGDAAFFGSTGGLRLNKPIVAMTPTASGKGYWLTASDGGIFAFGDAPFLGSTGAVALNRPIVSMATTLSGSGYWLAAADGGIFAFGDAAFIGSTGGIALNHPIVAISRTADGAGYWLIAFDGGVFAFGRAPFLGSAGGSPLNRPVVAVASLPATAKR